MIHYFSRRSLLRNCASMLLRAALSTPEFSTPLFARATLSCTPAISVAPIYCDRHDTAS